MTVFLAVTACFVILMPDVVPKSHGRNELQIKKCALRHAVTYENITGVRNLFNFPFHIKEIYLTGSANRKPADSIDIESYFRSKWNLFLWLILSAAAIPLLSFRGDKNDKQLSLFFVIFWFFVLCWNFSMLMIIVMTYSEMYMSTPRMIYIFAYLILASSFYIVSQIFFSKGVSRGKLFSFPLLMLASGFFVSIWWTGGMTYIKGLSFVLSIVVGVSAIFLLMNKKRAYTHLNRPPLLNTVIGAIFFLLPILGTDFKTMITRLAFSERPTIRWFDNNNPLGFSRSTIDFIRKLPSHKKFLVDPLGTHVLSVYAPHYLATIPQVISSVLRAYPTYSEIRAGRNPLFNHANVYFQHLLLEHSGERNIKNWSLPFDWFPEEAIDVNALSKDLLPLSVIKSNGNFRFELITYQDGEALRIYPCGKKIKGKRQILFGFDLKAKSIDHVSASGHRMVVVISARVSHPNRKTPRLFFENRKNTFKYRDIIVNSPKFEQYFLVTKTEGATNISRLVVNWRPKAQDEWIEIKDLKIFVLDASHDQLSFKHNTIKNWLNQNGIEYIMIDKKYYSEFLLYFKRYSSDYDIVFDDKNNKQMVVRYLSLL
jgi:hypothetical protein